MNTVRERVEMQRINPEKGVFDYTHPNITSPIIASKNLDISAVFHDTPQWAKTKNASLGKNLFDIRDAMLNASSAMQDRIQSWEIWNEQDTQFYTREPADMYSAYFKAAAIGISEGSPKTKKSMGGLCMEPSVTPYDDLMLQSGIMDYADIYNYHAHIIDDGKAYQDAELKVINNQNILKNKYDKTENEIWITEAGMFAKIPFGSSELSDEQLKKQARYSVTGTVSSLALGTDKHFWFIMPKYKENGADFGTFNSDDMPNPSYTAMAVMTKNLGEAKYLGEISSLQDNICGQLFSNEGKDVAVLWGKENGKAVSLYSDFEVTVMDMMGAEQNILPVDGKVTVNVGIDPIYIIWGKDCDIRNYKKITYTKEIKAPKTFTDAQKIVIVANPQNINYTEAKTSGYRIKSGNIFPIDIYNFSDKIMVGEINAIPEFSGTIEAQNKNVSIAPNSKVTVDFLITANNFIPDYEYDVAFSGVFNAQATSPSVCHVSFEYPQSKLNEINKFKNRTASTDTSNASAWNKENKSGGTSTANTGTQEGSIDFSVNFPTQGTDNWFYPAFSTASSTNAGLATSTGIAFTITSSVARADVSLNAFVDHAGGQSRYFLGTEAFFIEKGTHNYFIPWNRFVPHGVNADTSNIPVPSKIGMIQLGISTKSAGTISFTVNNIGYYTSNQAPLPKGDITINGITDGSTITANELSKMSISLPQTVSSDTVRYVVNNKNMTLNNIKNLGSGKYVLDVIGYTNTNYAISKTITFYLK